LNSEEIGSPSDLELKLSGENGLLFQGKIQPVSGRRQKWYHVDLPKLEKPPAPGSRLRLELSGDWTVQPWIAHYSQWPMDGLSKDGQKIDQASLCLRLGVDSID